MVCGVAGLMKDINKCVILRAKVGGAYSSEVKLFESILEKMEFEGFYLIGDKGYDSIKIIKEIKKRKFKPVIKVRETFRIEVKSEERKEAKEYSERKEIYKQRWRIEGVFGNIKQALGSYEPTRIEKLAKIYILSKFCIYNVSVLLSILFLKLFSLFSLSF